MKTTLYTVIGTLITAVAAQAAAISYGNTTITTAETIGAGDLLRQADTATIVSGGSITVTTSSSSNAQIGQQNTGGLIIDGGALTLNPGASILLGNGSGGNGIIDLRDGTFSGAPSGTFFIGRDRADGIFIIRGGTATFALLPTFDALGGGATSQGNGSIDFADVIGGGVSTGSLTITGADETYYQGLYTAGDLTFQGTNTQTFGDVFSVSGNTLSAIPEPSVAGLFAFCAIGSLMIRRRQS